MPARVTLKDIHKTFAQGTSSTRAVRGVNLSIEPGEMFFLLGPSGCGKTTIMRMIAGFADPTAGSIHFDQRDVTRTPPNKRDTGMVFQSYALWPHMTVEANVAFGLRVRKVPRRERRARVAAALDAVQMSEYSKRKPNQLSGGQQQRVALARALVIRPSVLLLDEPLSNLDARLRADLRRQIRDICKASSITTIYVTHDQEEALSMADRIAVIKDGEVVQVGSPAAVYDSPASVFVARFLGDVNIFDAIMGKLTVEGCELDVSGVSVRARRDPGADASTREGAAVIAAVRPENVAITAGDGLPARVRSVSFLGHAYTIAVAINERWEVTARLHHRRGRLVPKPGDDVYVAIDPAAVLVYPV